MRCPQCNFEGEPLDGGCPRCGYGRMPGRGTRSLPLSQAGREVAVSAPVSLVATRPLIRGDMLRQGRYHIVEELTLPRNQQGQGKAWLANDAQSVNRLVMIREIIPTPEQAAQIETEVRTLAQRLAELGQHRGFPHLIDMFSERGCYYIVLQQPEGRSLAQLVQQQGGPLPERLVAAFGCQLCEIIQVLASQQPPLVHGAISPETVIVSPDGEQVTLIFLPLFPPRLPAELQGKAIASYFAPEQFNGVTDTRTDLYGIAATLHHALTGYDPSLHMAFFYPPARRLNPRASQRMESILTRGLRVAAAQRYLRPGDMLRDLQAIASQAGGAAVTRTLRPDGLRPAARQQSSSRSMVLTFSIITVVVFALLFGGIFLATMRAPASTSGSPDPAATATALATQTAIAQQARQASNAWQQELTREQQSWQTQHIAVSDGRFIFDTYDGRKDVQQKLAAAHALQTGDLDTAASQLSAAVTADPTDAEALIYSQNLLIEQNGQPYVTIVVGLSFSTDPQTLATTRSMLQAIYVAQYEINEFAWLPHNYQLRILIAGSPPDMMSVTTAAHFIVNRLTQAANLDHIIGVVGWPSSAQTNAVRDLIGSAKVPLVSQLAPDVNLAGNPYFFRISPPYNVQGNALAEFALQQLHAKGILVMRSPESAASVALANAFIARAQMLHGTVINNARDTFSTLNTTPDGYRTSIDDALASQADVIFLAGSDVDAVRLAHEIGTLSRLQPGNTALAKLRILTGPMAATSLLLGQGTSLDAQLVRMFPQDMQRIYALSYADPSEWAGVPQLQQPTLFTDWSGIFQNQKQGLDNAPPPDQNAIMTYDAVRVIARAASYVKGTLNGSSVRDMLDAMGNGSIPAFQGVSGLISFDSLGNPGDKAMAIVTVQPNSTGNSYQFSTVKIFGMLH
jgi:ABC-type branched-subunit amino acid transport system substrate-binding protein/serine/threonine protein kinase